uniref:Putative secreted peptide n=1 Tax=Anopheles braziliensis TaxID=58242 RepID=A0A2M3ZVI5_9DIPT
MFSYCTFVACSCSCVSLPFDSVASVAVPVVGLSGRLESRAGTVRNAGQVTLLVSRLKRSLRCPLAYRNTRYISRSCSSRMKRIGLDP